MREEPFPRRRTLDGSTHTSDNFEHGRRSTTDGSSSYDASGGGARGQGPAPAYSSARNISPAAAPATATAAAPAVSANMANPVVATDPAYTVPSQRDAQSVTDLAYFHTEDWPFAAEQYDRENEKGLSMDDRLLDGKREIPQLTRISARPIEPGVGRLGSFLADWDEECALKHLKAVEPSVVSHQGLHDFTLMEGEFAENVIDLAGLENAPGLLHNISQRCRLIFTNQKRLVFTQANHSAEVGVPKMTCCFALMHCFHDRWSTRRWSSFYAAINATEVLQVFVQQTLTTSYMSTSCRGDEICDFLWCSVGGVMKSAKDLDAATQTLGDFDQGSCVRRWDKTRFMRHALVIRALNPSPFTNGAPLIPLFRNKTYRFLIFGLFLVAFPFLFITTAFGIIMMVAIVVAIAGAYTSSAQRNQVHQAGDSAVQFSKTLVGSQSVSGLVYVLSFLVAIS